jgi:hypothetical protein
VNHESPARLEPNNQILAAPADGGDTLTLKLGRDLARVVGPGQAGVEDLDPLEAAADQLRLQADAYRLDLR